MRWWSMQPSIDSPPPEKCWGAGYKRPLPGSRGIAGTGSGRISFRLGSAPPARLPHGRGVAAHPVFESVMGDRGPADHQVTEVGHAIEVLQAGVGDAPALDRQLLHPPHVPDVR